MLFCRTAARVVNSVVEKDKSCALWRDRGLLGSAGRTVMRVGLMALGEQPVGLHPKQCITPVCCVHMGIVVSELSTFCVQSEFMTVCFFSTLLSLLEVCHTHMRC